MPVLRFVISKVRRSISSPINEGSVGKVSQDDAARSPVNKGSVGKVSQDVAYCSPVKLPSHIPRDLTASLLRPCYDPGRSTVAMDAAGTQRGRSEEPKDAQGILIMHKTVAETRVLAESWLGCRGIAVESP